MSSMVPQHRKEAIEALGAKVKIVGNNSDQFLMQKAAKSYDPFL